MIRALPLLFACGFLHGQSLIPDPQTLQERWDTYVKKTYNWKRIGIVTAETAFEQSFQLNKCGRPPYCFPHEIGGALMRRTARTTMELGAGALLHEDLRRRPSDLTSFRQRFTYAMVHAPLAIGPDGEWRPAYSRFAGTLGAVTVTSAWNGKPLTAEHLSKSFGLTATSYFQDALLTEFGPDLKQFGHHVADRLRHRPK